MLLSDPNQQLPTNNKQQASDDALSGNPNNQQKNPPSPRSVDMNVASEGHGNQPTSDDINQQPVTSQLFNQPTDLPQNDIINDTNFPADDFGTAPVSSPGADLYPTPIPQSLGSPVIQASQPVADDPIIAARNQPLSGPFDPLNDDLLKPDTAPVQDDINTGLQKERELLQRQDQKYIEEIGKEIELEKELKDAGVEKMGEEIELPEMIKKEGIEKIEQEITLPSQPTQTVPLTQVQIKKALHQKISEAVLWLAYWCMRQLKIQNKKID